MMVFMFFMFGLRESAVGEALETVDVVADTIVSRARARISFGGRSPRRARAAAGM